MQTMRQQQKEQTRRRIMDTAFALFSLKGFAVTTDEVAKAAGLSHGAIFVHFPTREELLFRVLEQFAREIGDKLHALATAGKDLPELLHAHMHVLQEYEPFYRNMLCSLASLPAEGKLLLISLQATMSSHFSFAIEKGQREGRIKALPLHMLFNTWLGLLHYYMLHAELFAPGGSVLECCCDELIDTFAALIAK